MKEKLKFPYHYICLCAALVIGISMLIAGSFVDQQLSQSLFVNGSGFARWYGIILSGLSEQPAYSIAAIAGIGLIASNISKKMDWKNIVFIILGALAAGAGLYYSFKTFNNISSTTEAYTGDAHKTLITILAIVFIVLVDGSLSFLVIRYNLKHPEKKQEFTRLCIALFAILAIEILIQTGLKYLASRPRPRYLYGFTEPNVDADLFRNWWEWEPFACMHSSVKSDNLKSFPSGHSMTATAAAFMLPLIYNFYSQKKTTLMRSVFFGIGIAWAVINAFGRVCAGAHWLSDTAGGIVFSTIICYCAYLLVAFIYSKIDEKKEPTTQAE